MINKIEFLRNFGIFQNYTAKPELVKFSKYNLFYGWNGCGKSTLSKLFAGIENKKIDDDFAGCQFKLDTSDGELNQDNFARNTSNVKVFNQDFIKANIKWEEGVKSILLIAEDKIEDRKKLEILKAELFINRENQKKIEDENTTLQKEINSFLSSSAKTIKESFKIIDTSDKHYFNYDKTKFEKFLQDNPGKVWEKSSIINEKQKTELIKALQPVEKEEIQFTMEEVRKEIYIKGRERILDLLGRNIVAKTISRLRDNSSINNWVREGLEIHRESKSSECEFCSQPLPANRIADLSEHFNDAYKEMLEKIDAAILWSKQLQERVHHFPDGSQFYNEFQEEYQLSRSVFVAKDLEMKAVILCWQTLLENKKSSPFNQFELATDDIEQIIDDINKAIRELHSVVNKHNAKTKNFEADLKANKAKLELHYTAELVQQSPLKKDQDKIALNLTNLAKIMAKTEEQQKSIDVLSASLINEEKGADQFNKFLHKFLGRTDISLKFNKKEKGYQILRGKLGKVARNLSEGEKTAIAFVYFVIKLKEQGNDIEKTIVVVDDPISSFDSNCLFHSYSFLKQACDKAEQLFVFTHNFQYYRLIREWFIGKNKIKEGIPVIKSAFFAIESSDEEERTSTLKNAHDTLQKYNSEYHYVFSVLHKMTEDEIKVIDKAYLVGNLARKLLEGFLSFKYPRARSDFRRLLDDCCKDTELAEKIYKFINKYSHNQLIEFHDTPVDNLLAEGKGVIKDVFKLMETMDPHHYKEMQEICN